MNKNHRITIGILAGMGPKSTSPFLDLVIQECQSQYGAIHDIDFPHIIIYCLPTPFYVDRELDDEKMRMTVCEGLQRLEKSGVDFIAMPCNTVHKYFDDLKKCINIPLLSIVEATIDQLNERSKKVAIFATSSTMQSNLYQDQLLQKGFEFIFKEEWQQHINTLIQGAKQGKLKEELSEAIQILSASLEKEGVDTILIACTDLTKIAQAMKGFEVIDSSHALAKETVKKYLHFKKGR